MYKMLVFLKKSDDEEIVTHFKEIKLDHLSKIAGKEIRFAQVENNFLLEEKYTLFCEISSESKDKFDKMMATKAGKDFNKDLISFHQFITLIFVNYNNR